MDLENQGNQSHLEGNVQLGGQANYQNVQSYSGSGQTAVPVKDDTFNSLEEPVSQTIMRDLKMIGYKLKYVLLPKMREERGKELRNWDLWGPLILCLMLALTLSISSNDGAETIFAIIFVIVWAGAFIVTLNAQLLGGKISFFQSVCVLGYCVFPINLAALLVAFTKSFLPFIVKLILVAISFGWSTLSSVGFMSTLVSEERKILAVYPVFLFYLFLAWFSLIV